MLGVVVPLLSILLAVPGLPRGGCPLEGPSGRLSPGVGRSGLTVECASGPVCPLRWLLLLCLSPPGREVGLLSVSPLFLQGYVLFLLCYWISFWLVVPPVAGVPMLTGSLDGSPHSLGPHLGQDNNYLYYHRLTDGMPL